MFDEGTSMVFFREIQFTEPFSLGDFIQIVAMPCPDDNMEPSPNPVILLVSSLSRKSKSDHFVRMCNVDPESIIIGVCAE